MTVNPTSAAAVTPLDEQAISRLRELDPDGRLRVLERILTTYETSLLRLTGQLVQARDRGDGHAVSEIAHTLKSSSASVGALAFARECAEVERLLRAGAEVDLGVRCDILLAEADRALAAVRAMLRA